MWKDERLVDGRTSTGSRFLIRSTAIVIDSSGGGGNTDK